MIATSTAIIGPNDFEPSRMGRVLRDFANGKLRAYLPGGFEFVATGDLVEGHLLAMAGGRTGHKYIFSTEFLTVDTLMDIYAEVTGRPRPPRLPPALMASIASVWDPVARRIFPRLPERLTPAAVRFLRMQRRADCTKAKRELGYHPTSIARAVAEAYECFRRRGLITGSPRSRPPGQSAAATSKQETIG